MTPQRDKQRSAITLWLIALIILVGIVGVVGYWAYQNVSVRVVITNQPAKVTILEPMRVTADIQNKLDIRLDTIIHTKVPIDTSVSLPVDDTLDLEIKFDTKVPLSLTVEVDETISINKKVHVEGVVNTEVMGVNLKLPISGDVGLDAKIPIHFKIPVDQRVRLAFTAPVKARIKENLVVPLDTTIVTDIPIETDLSVPVNNKIRARVVVKDQPLKTLIQYAELELPLDTVLLQLNDKSASGTAGEPTDKKSNSNH